MARKEFPCRSFEKIFQQAKLVGPDNVILHDGEVGVVEGGGGEPVAASTIANRRWKGTFTAPYQRGAGNRVETRLSDVLAERERRLRKRA